MYACGAFCVFVCIYVCVFASICLCVCTHMHTTATSASAISLCMNRRVRVCMLTYRYNQCRHICYMAVIAASTTCVQKELSSMPVSRLTRLLWDWPGFGQHPSCIIRRPRRKPRPCFIPRRPQCGCRCRAPLPDHPPGTAKRRGHQVWACHGRNGGVPSLGILSPSPIYHPVYPLAYYHPLLSITLSIPWHTITLYYLPLLLTELLYARVHVHARSGYMQLANLFITYVIVPSRYTSTTCGSRCDVNNRKRLTLKFISSQYLHITKHEYGVGSVYSCLVTTCRLFGTRVTGRTTL
jgi:hypothetical protein